MKYVKSKVAIVTTKSTISIPPMEPEILVRSIVIMVIAKKISRETCSMASISSVLIVTSKVSRTFLAIAPAKRQPIKYGISI